MPKETIPVNNLLPEAPRPTIRWRLSPESQRTRKLRAAPRLRRERRKFFLGPGFSASSMLPSWRVRATARQETGRYHHITLRCQDRNAVLAYGAPTELSPARRLSDFAR